VIREYADPAGVADWGRIESFQDRRDTASTAEMDQTGAETLEQAAKPIGVQMDVLDTASQEFLRDWNVGDHATARIGDASIADIIVEATITLEPNAPLRVAPALGAATVNLVQWRTLSAHARRLRQLERN